MNHMQNLKHSRLYSDLFSCVDVAENVRARSNIKVMA